MAEKYNIRVDQGASFRLAFRWCLSLTDENGDAILDADGNEQAGSPLSIYGYLARLQVRKAVTSTTAMLSLTEQDGITISQPDVSMLDRVEVASTSNLSLSAVQTIDGVAVVAGDRVLAMGQTDPDENGIYVVAAGAWSRAADADAATSLNGVGVWVHSGTLLENTTWLQTATLVDFTDAQVWEEDTTIGVVLVDFTDEQTAAMTSSGVYDLELESGAGDVTRVLQGKMRLSMEVTR